MDINFDNNNFIQVYIDGSELVLVQCANIENKAVMASVRLNKDQAAKIKDIIDMFLKT